MDLQGTYLITQIVLVNRCGPAARAAGTPTALHHAPSPTHVRLSRRADYQARLTYFEIRVGNHGCCTGVYEDLAVCTTYTTPAQGEYTLTCDQPRVGRFVMVRLKPQAELPPGTTPVRDGYLTVCELQVYGTPA